MKKKKGLIRSFCLIILTAGSLIASAQKKFELFGTVSGKDGQSVQLVRDYYGNPEVLATDTIRYGKFHFSSSVNEVIPVFVNFGRAGSYRVILEPAIVHFTLRPNGRKSVTGGKYNKLLFGFEFQPAFIKADDAMRENSKKGIDNIKGQQEQYEAMQVFLRRNELYSNYLLNLMNNHKENRVKVMAAVMLELQPDRSKAMEIVEKAVPELGESSLLIREARRQNKSQETMINARKGKMNGQTYIDFKAATLNGDSVQLSTLMKGNSYTLLQFWASWCIPCRHEIPLLKKMYGNYQSKGFGIVAFSLDDNKLAWMKASEKENFRWPNISDQKAFKSEIIKMYQINGIPANMIIDQEGKIVASNLVGDELEKKVEELMK